MQDTATVAAGCFWGVEEYFRQLSGVVSTRVGYTGGDLKNPSYEDVCQFDNKHVEAVEITFDDSVLSYNDLLEKFWSFHNSSLGFYKRQYQSVIFPHSDQQFLAAENFLNLEKGRSVKEITTVIEILKEFYPAEERHQHYVQKRNDRNSARSNR